MTKWGGYWLVFSKMLFYRIDEVIDSVILISFRPVQLYVALNSKLFF